MNTVVGDVQISYTKVDSLVFSSQNSHKDWYFIYSLVYIAKFIRIIGFYVKLIIFNGNLYHKKSFSINFTIYQVK